MPSDSHYSWLTLDDSFESAGSGPVTARTIQFSRTEGHEAHPWRLFGAPQELAVSGEGAGFLTSIRRSVNFFFSSPHFRSGAGPFGVVRFRVRSAVREEGY